MLKQCRSQCFNNTNTKQSMFQMTLCYSHFFWEKKKKKVSTKCNPCTFLPFLSLQSPIIRKDQAEGRRGKKSFAMLVNVRGKRCTVSCNLILQTVSLGILCIAIRFPRCTKNKSVHPITSKLSAVNFVSEQ